MDANENSWFPVARAMCLQQQSDEINERLQRIEERLQTYVVGGKKGRGGLERTRGVGGRAGLDD